MLSFRAWRMYDTFHHLHARKLSFLKQIAAITRKIFNAKCTQWPFLSNTLTQGNNFIRSTFLTFKLTLSYLWTLVSLLTWKSSTALWISRPISSPMTILEIVDKRCDKLWYKKSIAVLFHCRIAQYKFY